MDKRAIGIFDSGVGGLTVLKELEKAFPEEDIIYVGDTKRFPYGNKTKESIIELSRKITEYLIDREVKLIVIACGTATSQALTSLKKIFKVPIIGIIEPTVTNEIKKNTKKVGIIATRGTIRSDEWKKQIQILNPEVEVINCAAPLLAPMAEEGWIDNEVAELAIKEYVKPFLGKKIEKLILGCTHYPMFEKLFRKELGEEVVIINTGKEVAQYLERFLKEKEINNQNNKERKIEIDLTDTECNFVNVAKIVLGKEDVEIQRINLDKC